MVKKLGKLGLEQFRYRRWWIGLLIKKSYWERFSCYGVYIYSALKRWVFVRSFFVVSEINVGIRIIIVAIVLVIRQYKNIKYIMSGHCYIGKLVDKRCMLEWSK